MIVKALRQDLWAKLEKLCAGASTLKPLHWIDGIGDVDDPPFGDSADLCRECALAAIAEHGSDQLTIGGGLGGEAYDGPTACESCGCRLDYALNNFGVDEELGRFQDNPPADADDWQAFAIALQGMRDDDQRWPWVEGLVLAARVREVAS